MRKCLFLILIFYLPFCVNSQNLDIRILRSINSQEALSSDDFFRVTSNSEVYFVIGIPVGMAVTGLIKDDKDMFRNACVSLIAAGISSAVTNGFKYSINRDRPFVTYSDILKKGRGGSPSFPSGHTSSAFATATSLSLAYPKWYVIVAAYGWAGTVAYSRMHLGVHYPTDVLAGAGVGAGSAFLTYKVNQKLNSKRRPKPCNCPI